VSAASLRLATRGSPLALWQAETAARVLRAAFADLEVTLVTVRSGGDADTHTPLAAFGRTGIFTAEVDRTLLQGDADAAVHSLKDMTTTLEAGIVLAAVLPRGPVEDALAGAALADLSAGARVATGSARRRAMLLRARPDLACVAIRGNVGTRLAKLDAGEAEALLVARAGLVRLGLEQRIAEVLDTERFLPAVGQGAIGLTCRADDGETLERLRAVCDSATRAAVEAERAFLAVLRGGCNVPVGAHARVEPDGGLHLTAQVLARDGSRTLAGERRAAPDEAAAAGRALAEELLGRGAAELLAEARR